MTIDEILEEELVLSYYETAKIQMEAAYAGDYKKGNRASDKLIKYNKLIKSDFQSYKSVVKKLLNLQNPNVIIWIANAALDEKFEMDFVVSNLKSIAGNRELGIISLNAKMILKTHGLL